MLSNRHGSNLTCLILTKRIVSPLIMKPHPHIGCAVLPANQANPCMYNYHQTTS